MTTNKTNNNETRLIFVDVEALGKSPVNGTMTEFGCVDYESRKTFHGKLVEAIPDPKYPAVPFIPEGAKRYDAEVIMFNLIEWLHKLGSGRKVLVSDNPAYDFMWMAGEFDRWNLVNPFGHSGRRIADIYAGLCGNWRNTQTWKEWRVTPHDHNPVNDAMGNVEAFEAMLRKFNQKY